MFYVEREEMEAPFGGNKPQETTYRTSPSNQSKFLTKIENVTKNNTFGPWTLTGCPKQDCVCMVWYLWHFSAKKVQKLGNRKGLNLVNWREIEM